MQFKYLAIFSTLAYSTLGAASEIKPPRFPATCKNVEPLPRAELRINSAVYRFNHKLSCQKVGSKCKTRWDCNATSEECKKAFPKFIEANTTKSWSSCEEGICRAGDRGVSNKCDCFFGCKNGLVCESGKCRAKRVKACGACGEYPKEGGCCGSGISSEGKRCFCGTGVGEGCSVKGFCPGKTEECCGKGTKNDGRCCNEGSCNQKCLHVVG